MRRTSVIAVLILLLGLWACDKPHPAAPEASTPLVQNSQGATRSSNGLSGETKDLQLILVPLALKAPVEWKRVEAGGVTAIEGPLGGGEAEIIISRLEPMNVERTKLWFAAATQPSEGEFLTNEVRDINGLKVWETAMVEHAATEPTDSATGVRSWVSLRFTILVPQGPETLPCSLGFSGLDRSVYESQKSFIDSIMGTIRVSDLNVAQ